MNRTDLLKKLLPGFFPLIVFIIADEIWGTKIGLIVAVSFGIGQFLFTYIKEKIVDKFVLFDTALIIILGGISIILDNEIFFKLKPGLIEIILVGILGLSSFSKVNILMGMSKRYMKDMTLNDEQLKQFTKSLRIMFYIFSAHTLLVFYSAFFMSKEAWVFISTGLFYILFGVYFLYEFINKKYKFNLAYQQAGKQLKSEEWLPLVNENGEIIGKAPRLTCHTNKDFMHPVIHMHVVNNKKQILLQKRSATKEIQPDKWDTAVGGHISFNEKIEDALKRETAEEIGLTDFQASHITKYKWESEVETELVFMFVTNSNNDFSIHNEEVDECRFWSIKDIKQNLGKNIFTPNFEYEFQILQKLLK